MKKIIIENQLHKSVKVIINDMEETSLEKMEVFTISVPNNIVKVKVKTGYKNKTIFLKDLNDYSEGIRVAIEKDSDKIYKLVTALFSTIILCYSAFNYPVINKTTSLYLIIYILTIFIPFIFSLFYYLYNFTLKQYNIESEKKEANSF